MNTKEWLLEFAKALETGEFSWQAKSSSENWGCCALGSFVNDIAPDRMVQITHYKFEDAKRVFVPKAFKLGIKFDEQIHRHDVKGAMQTFFEIHAMPKIFKKGVRK